MRPNKELLLEWKSHPVTQELRKAIEERVKSAFEELLISVDPDYDNRVKGLTRAYQEILEWEPEIEEKDEDGKVRTSWSEDSD